MRLSRTARAHDTRISRESVRSELFADFAEGQRVKTVDGVMGTIAAIEDGPFPGTEGYRVTLDHGMGGGLYSTGQLTPVAERKTSEHHTADQDYEELGTILYDRPDIARTASRRPFDHEARASDPGALGPNWIHTPASGYDPERYEHHDLDRQHTLQVSRLPTARSRWEGSIKNWCGSEHRLSDGTQRYHEEAGKAQSSANDAAHQATNPNLALMAEQHRRTHHDAEGNCYAEGGEKPMRDRGWSREPYESGGKGPARQDLRPQKDRWF